MEATGSSTESSLPPRHTVSGTFPARAIFWTRYLNRTRGPEASATIPWSSMRVSPIRVMTSHSRSEELGSVESGRWTTTPSMPLGTLRKARRASFSSAWVSSNMAGLPS